MALDKFVYTPAYNTRMIIAPYSVVSLPPKTNKNYKTRPDPNAISGNQDAVRKGQCLQRKSTRSNGLQGKKSQFRNKKKRTAEEMPRRIRCKPARAVMWSLLRGMQRLVWVAPCQSSYASTTDRPSPQCFKFI